MGRGTPHLSERPEAWWGEKPQGGHPGYLAGGASESGQGAGPMGRPQASEKSTLSPTTLRGEGGNSRRRGAHGAQDLSPWLLSLQGLWG